MPRATRNNGTLQIIEKCYIQVGNPAEAIRIDLRILPEITDSKAANYQNETIIGRASPIVNYAYSEPRTVSMELTFIVMEEADINRNLYYLRVLESLVYPTEYQFIGGDNPPYGPPQICRIKCGKLFGGDLDDVVENTDGVCCILKNYSVRFQSDVPWDEATMLPYKFTVSCQFEVVYACSQLPCNNRIIISGR